MNIFKTASKIYRTGMFLNIQKRNNYLSFEDCNQNKYVLQPYGKNNYIFHFRIGHVVQWTERGLTYESEYQVVGDIPRALFVEHCSVLTDNPDYVLRLSLSHLKGEVND